MFQQLLLSRPQVTRPSQEKCLIRGPSQTKTETCFPKVRGPVLALRAGMQEEISLQNSGARLPETIPKNFLRMEQQHRDCTIHSRCFSRPSKLCIISSISRACRQSYIFAGAPVMQSYNYDCEVAIIQATNHVFQYLFITTAQHIYQSAKSFAQIHNDMSLNLKTDEPFHLGPTKSGPMATFGAPKRRRKQSVTVKLQVGAR